MTIEDIRGPTSERLRRSAGAFELGGSERERTRIYRFQDAPLERLAAKRAIDPKEYSALMKFKTHWHYAGLDFGLASVDLNRIFASDPGSFSGMAKTEKQAFHRQQYRAAVEQIGLRNCSLVQAVVCEEMTVVDAGFKYRSIENEPQARAVATECLRDAGYRLAKLWGI